MYPLSSTPHRRRLIAALSAIPLTAMGAGAAVSFTSLTRSVSASSDGISQSFSETTFGVFDRVAAATGGTSGLSEARQVSTVDAGSASVAFMGSARTTFDFPGAATSAMSSLELFFTIDALTPFQGEIVYFPPFPASTTPPQLLIRSAPSGATIINLLAVAGPMGAVSGQLGPGDYSLLVSVPNPNPMMTVNGGSTAVSLGLGFIPAPSTLILPALAWIVMPTRRRPRQSASDREALPG